MAIIFLIGLGRGLFWSNAYSVPFGDEGAHFSYVESLATGKGVPVTGKSYLTNDVLKLRKRDPTATAQTAPVQARNTDSRWGFNREQYEGYQTPLYHFVMVPFYWLGRPFGVLGAFWALRLVTLLTTLLAVPLVYFVARELLPGREAVWLLAPAVLVTMQMVNSQYSLIDNDGLMISMGALCVLALLKAHHGLTTRRAVAFGAAIGLCALVKGTAVSLAPLLAFGLLWVVSSSRPPMRLLVRWLAIAVGVSAAVLAPWILFNLHVYHSVSGGQAEAALVEPIIGKVPVNLAGVRHLNSGAVSSLFAAQDLGRKETSLYRHLWAVGAAIAVGGGLVVSALRHRWSEIGRQAWLTVSLPLGLVVLVLVDLSQSHEGAIVEGRHLGVLLVAFCIAVAFGAVSLFGSRIGTIALLAFLVVCTSAEVSHDQQWVRSWYARNTIGTAAPVLDQPFTDGQLTTKAISIHPPCPATYISMAFAGPVGAVTVDGRAPVPAGSQDFWTTYRLPDPVSRPFIINFSTPTSISVAGKVRSGAIFLADEGQATPAVRVYCDVPNATALRFDQLYTPQHPFGLDYRSLVAWPKVEAALGALLAAIVALAIGADALVRRRHLRDGGSVARQPAYGGADGMHSSPGRGGDRQPPSDPEGSEDC